MILIQNKIASQSLSNLIHKAYEYLDYNAEPQSMILYM